MPITLFNNDCLIAMKDISDNSVELILTDPPYNLGNFMKERATNLKQMRANYFGAAGWDNLDTDEWTDSMSRFFNEAARVMHPGGSLVVFMSIIRVQTLIGLAQNSGFYYKTTGIWHKQNPMPRNMNLHFINSTEAWIYFTYKKHTGIFNNEGKAIHDFIETPIASLGEKKYGKHPTQKPIALMQHFVQLLSNEGDCVLDPFMGSGSAGVAAKRLNRSFVGIELCPEYFEIARRRIEEVNSNETKND